MYCRRKRKLPKIKNSQWVAGNEKCELKMFINCVTLFSSHLTFFEAREKVFDKLMTNILQKDFRRFETYKSLFNPI